MKNSFERLINNLEKLESLIIGERTFIDELVSDESIQCSLLGTISFFDVAFEKVDFTGSTFVNCKFENCTFINVTFEKCDFFNIIFDNCKIETSDFTRASFSKEKFQNCNFYKVDLTATIFRHFEFNETKFSDCTLELIMSQSVKLCKLNQLTLVEDSSDFGKFLEGEDGNIHKN